jgi:hypothetical protein
LARKEDLPPDLTLVGIGFGRWDEGCTATREGYHCTRRYGHTGRHAAGTGVRIVAVWP